MRDYASNLRKFYLAAVLSGFAYFYNGVDTLYFRHFDLSFEQLGFLISAYLITTLVCEVPTGSFADVYGKKPSVLMGLVWNIIQTAIVFFAGQIESRLGRNLSIAATVLVNPALFFGLYHSEHFVLSAVILGLYFGAMSFREVVVDSYINAHISSSHRAVVLSVNSMLVSGMAVVVLPLLGRLVDTSGLGSGLMLLAIGTLALGVVSYLAYRRLARPAG
jgi:MFS family permease